MNIADTFAKGGIAMYPLLLLSFLSLSVIIERVWFWWKMLTREREISGRVLEAARRDWDAAADVASRATDQPIGRFLNSALGMQTPDPEVFKLALEASADEELAAMRRGDKILEATIAIAPLLGLLGTVLGLISSLSTIRLGDIGTSATGEVTLGISEALISTATGLIVAIIALAFYRVFQGLLSGQAKLFQQAGNELELLYRRDWAMGKRPLSTHTSGFNALPGSSDANVSPEITEATPE
ncbi:MotA/TolQ/ExbB proton channel family protein [Leptolyngbya sp. AN02str]|uniref:MotA/TolQ/ExbB proton channel family protein n=1 Tax=Leptolyngbya sp. AN02str TaxID=3423363 RepID=UPI003D31DDD5